MDKDTNTTTERPITSKFELPPEDRKKVLTRKSLPVRLANRAREAAKRRLGGRKPPKKAPTH